jgi:phosphoribulokinase
VSPKSFALRRLSGGTERPVMLAVVGDSAAGKTTLVRGLAAALADTGVSAICVDDYHRYDRIERRSVSFTPLHPECNYMDIMEQHLQLLAMGDPVLKPVYNHHDGTLDRPVLVEPASTVIVEGLLALHTPLTRACFDLSVYLDPPEEIRRGWKIRRDTRDRGYREDEVLADLERREPDSEAFIRPQRRWADIVVRFAPISERGEDARAPLSATVLLRPTAAHPDLSSVLNDDTREAIHLKLMRDDDGRPVDAIHVHAYASPETAHRVEDALWEPLGINQPRPTQLGEIEPGIRNEPLAVVQLILLYHLVLAGRAALQPQ